MGAGRSFSGKKPHSGHTMSAAGEQTDGGIRGAWRQNVPTHFRELASAPSTPRVLKGTHTNISRELGGKSIASSLRVVGRARNYRPPLTYLSAFRN